MLKRLISLLTVVFFMLTVVCPPAVFANPEDPNVVVGDVTFEELMNQLNININSQQAIIEWISFCIANGETVNFNLPNSSSIALNRVVGMDPSYILGNLISNGQIFLINPNGILFGANSRVDTAGLVASTLNISNDDFLAGRYTFYGPGGSVVNQGILSAPGGYVALLGNRVENSGLITSQLGTVALAAGEKITLGLDPQGLISVVIEEAVTQNADGASDAVLNSGTIQANGGTVILTADALNGVFDNAVNNAGIIEARGLENNNGEVLLYSQGEESVVTNTGIIDVTAMEAGAEGGHVELSGGILNYETGTVNLGGGSILFDPTNFFIGDIAELVLQLLNGDITITASNNIYLMLGSLGGDDILNLYNITGGETFTLLAGNNIFFSNDTIVTNGGDVNLLTDLTGWYGWGTGWVNSDGNGTVNLGTGGGVITNGGNINIDTNDIILSAALDAGSGDITMVVDNDIVDSHSGLDIIANSLSIYASNGIGSNDAIETAVSEILLANYSAGDINIDNDGALSVAGINNAGGSVAINAYSPITVNGDVISLDDITLIANGSDGDLTVNADVISTNSGEVYLEAGNDYIQNGDSSVHSDYSVRLLANNDIVMNDNAAITAGFLGIAALNNMTMNGGSVIDSNGFDFLHVGNDLVMNDSSSVQGALDILNVGNDMTMNGSSSLDAIGVLVTVNNNLTMNSMSSINGSLGLMFIGNDIVMNGNSAIDVGDIDIDIDNDLVMNDNSQILSDDLNINAGNNVYLGEIVSSYTNISAGGAILDNNGSDTNIYADDLDLEANNGIGSGDALETAVSNLQASNIYSGNIEIDNTGALNIYGNGVINEAAGGSIIISTASPLYVIDAPISADGDVILSANGANGDIYTGGWQEPAIESISGNIILSASNDIYLGYGGYGDLNAFNGSIYLNAVNNITTDNDCYVLIGDGEIVFGAGNDINILSTSWIHSNLGNISFQAGNDFYQVATAEIATEGGSVFAGADMDADGNGGFTQETGAAIVSNGGNISVQAGVFEYTGGENIFLSLLDAGTGNVFIGSGLGALIDNNGDSVNIIANELDIWAANGIGSNVDALDLNVNYLTAYTDGDMFTNELDGIVYGDITSGGQVNLLSNGFTSINGDIVGNDFVTVRTQNDDLYFDGGSVQSLNSGVGITTDNGDIYALTEGPHVIANGDSFISAPFGKVTPGLFPLDVFINGDLLLNISNLDVLIPTFQVYGNLIGTVNGTIEFPLLFPTSFPAPLNPPGFVYFNGTQIWPPTSNAIFQLMANAASTVFTRNYFEFLNDYRYVAADTATPQFYLYHPLNETDSAAFDGIGLDADAYEFIEDNIKSKRQMSPYYGSEAEGQTQE